MWVNFRGWQEGGTGEHLQVIEPILIPVFRLTLISLPSSGAPSLGLYPKDTPNSGCPVLISTIRLRNRQYPLNGSLTHAKERHEMVTGFVGGGGTQWYEKILEGINRKNLYRF
jgi:hypothetical protein